LDDINIQLRPFIEFVSGSSSSAEGAVNTPPRFKVVGSVPAGGLSITLTVGGGATFGLDYDYTAATTLTDITGTSASLRVTVPAGNYSDALANNIFSLPINIINDTVIENNKTILFTMPPNGPTQNFVNANATTCGGAFLSTTTHTVIDNDIDLRATKSTEASGTLTTGATLSYTLTFANVTPAVLTIAPFDGHDAATVTIADPAATGIILGAWTCTASGTTCPAATGSGPILQSVNLPVGASLTYQVRATLGGATQCLQNVTNTASISTTALSPSGVSLSEGTSVQSNPSYTFLTNTASVGHLLAACAELSITKSNGVSTLSAGQITTYSVVVSNAGPADANGAIFKDPEVSGLGCSAVSCSSTSGAAACGSLGAVNLGLLQGSGIVLNSFPAGSSYTFELTCGVITSGF
jgi:uncharacterized repeat protein (TIGR01451 family)